MPSLYETTATVGDVASSNFTTLYNASGLTVPNAGAGSVSGNLNVSGNLTVQGTSLLVGAVTLGSTLSLPNYTFPATDGSTDQVLTTDGSGNLYFTSVSALGASYTIQADTATGGADLTLVSSGGVLDSVKFAGGSSITVTRTDANTITISSDADNIPDGTAEGQLLYWDGAAWTADTNIEFSDINQRTKFINSVSSGSSVGAIELLRRQAALNDGDSVGEVYGQLVGTTKTFTHRLISTYNDGGADNEFRIQADASGTFTGGEYAQLFLDNSEVAIFGNQLQFLRAATGAPTQNATIRVNRGTSPDSTFIWDETADRWSASDGLAAQGNFYASGNISQDGDIISINADNTAVDSYVYFKGGSRYLKWNNTDQRFEFNESLYLSTPNEPPATFERQVTAAEMSPSEAKTVLRLVERVTDAPNNATDDGGGALQFARASGASGGALKLYGSVTSNYYGTTNTADINLLWSDDNFAESSPGVFPGTYNLLRLGSDDATFFNNSIYADYSVAGAAKIGINTNVPNYTLDVFGDANVSGDITISGIKVDLATPVQQGQILSVTNAVTPTISNSSDVTFASTTYRPTFIGKTGTVGRAQTSAAVINDTGAVAFGQGDGSGMLIGLDSDSQARRFITSLTSSFDTGGNYQFRVSNSTNSFANITGTTITGGNTITFSAAHGLIANQKIIYLTTTQNGLTQNTYYYVRATGLTTTQAQLSATLGGAAVALTNATGLTLGFQTATTRVIVADNNQLAIAGTNFVLNANGAGEAAVNATIAVERGTTGADAELFWNESTDRWYFDNGDGVDHPMVISIDDLSDVVITPPVGAGQLLVNDGTNWVNTPNIEFTSVTNRPAFINAVTGTSNSAAEFLKNTGSAVADGDRVAYVMGHVDGATRTYTYRQQSEYDSTGNNILRLQIDPVGNFAPASTTVITQALLDNNQLALNGSDLVLRANSTGIAAGDATITVERGTSGSDATFGWVESASTWFSNGNLTANGYIGTNSNDFYFNNDDGPAADTFINVKRGASADVNIKWNEATDRWQTTVDGTNYLNIPNQNLDTTDDVTFSSVTVDGVASFNSQTTTTTSTATVQISSTVRATQKVVISVTDNVTGDMHVLEALAFQTAAPATPAAYITTYGEMYSNAALAAFTADISGGAIRILATPASTNSTTFTVARIGVN